MGFLMFIDHLLSQGSAPVLHKMLDFTASRHELIAENIANISTPGYVQKDLSLETFQNRLRERMEMRKKAAPGSVRFDDIQPMLQDSRTGLLFHDGGNRSAEQLMSDLSSNAMRHNMYAELLRKQYDSLKSVIAERIA